MVAALETDGPVLLDVRVAQEENCYPMIPPGQAARDMGLSEPIDEIITSAGPRHQVTRTLPRHRELFLLALLDKHRTNLALARFQLIEVERNLG